MAIQLKNKPGPVCRITKRLLGQILIDGNFVTPRDLEAALWRQQETNEQLGEILLSMGALNSTDLKAVLSVQRDLASLEDSVKAAAGVRELLGQLLVRAKRINPGQLDAALFEQQTSGEKLGTLLVRLGLLNENELSAVLAFQHQQGSEAAFSSRFRLCEILVATGEITREQLEDVLNRQKLSKKKIGELLVEAGYVQPHQVVYGLQLQQKLVTAALIAALSMANMLGVQEAYAGSSTGPSPSAKINVAAAVLEHTSMRILSQMQELVVTNFDIVRGYVEIPAATRITVKSNNPAGYLLALEVMNDPSALFQSVHVVVGGREVQLSSGGGWIPQPYIRGGVTMDLTYRFILSGNAQPGTYSWPLSIQALSL